MGRKLLVLQSSWSAKLASVALGVLIHAAIHSNGAMGHGFRMHTASSGPPTSPPTGSNLSSSPPTAFPLLSAGKSVQPSTSTLQLQQSNRRLSAQLDTCAGTDSWGSAPYENEMLQLTNQARATGRSCGEYGYFPATGPVTYNRQLTCSAREHSEDMARRDYFAHEDPGTGYGGDTRIRQAGYDWKWWGENIAGNWPTPVATMDKWLNSPIHCQFVMKSQFKELGVGYYAVPPSVKSQYTNYWTQNYGSKTF